MTVDPRNGKVISAGTEVAEESSGFVPHLRYRGYLAHDARTYSPSIIPAASVYGVYSLSVALYNSIGGMLSDKYTSYTPAQHVYDLCLTISEEQLHIGLSFYSIVCLARNTNFCFIFDQSQLTLLFTLIRPRPRR